MSVLPLCRGAIGEGQCFRHVVTPLLGPGGTQVRAFLMGRWCLGFLSQPPDSGAWVSQARVLFMDQGCPWIGGQEAQCRVGEERSRGWEAQFQGWGQDPCPPLSGKVVWWVCLQEAVCARDGEGPEGGLAVSWGCPEGAGRGPRVLLGARGLLSVF